MRLDSDGEKRRSNVFDLRLYLLRYTIIFRIWQNKFRKANDFNDRRHRECSCRKRAGWRTRASLRAAALAAILAKRT
jgi:hypothetical protein